jgi:hypothetical protein
MRVLLVEDEAITAFDLTAEFELHGHVVLGPAKELEHSLSLAYAESRFDSNRQSIHLFEFGTRRFAKTS